MRVPETSAGRPGLAWLAAGGLVLGASTANAVPSFAVQTGRPCEACHVGGLGPQLTQFGREFKLNGYTLRAVKFNVPLAGFIQDSYTATSKAQSSPPAPHFADNDNYAVDQISLFVAGGVGDHFGAFVQTTYDGIARAFTWDNLDVRAVTKAVIGGVKTVLGVTLNNNPTLTDPFNTLPAWGFPYTSSALAPSAPEAPLINNLAQTTLGLTSYAWINDRVYVEFGGYRSPSGGFLIRAGADPTLPGNINGVAPYGRVAYEWNLGDKNVEVGAFGMDARIFPGHDQTTGLTDHYTDGGLDASFQSSAPGHGMITFNSRYTYESQRLNASTALGLAGQPRQKLQDLRFDASYYWRDKIGFSTQVFDTWGSPDDLLFESDRRQRPDTSGILFQIDGTPFGNGKSPLGPRFNLRVGVQYTAYFQFDGATTNFDTMGRNASDNNTFRVFTWVYF
ncbi:MAG TPA: hypothetical protein VK801_13025 [Caulobacteraceae bacterium]|jgi:hypothetical protein|nr:hypothetical protein [Caulobacteraceae bacterium]